ncbi:NADH-quinone oxidoreductase subunit NuoH [Komagataeibacter europaeus]|uniref:NADH-quinone oxidoreductase subunit NuoH n=1 Tax=Komagataeibacter europaeus TaxID=33995 RepID=UPI000237D77A|nr:NADH-quinone oxidoreductase subunit NuoH [Komagataeibacter europaeus]
MTYPALSAIILTPLVILGLATVLTWVERRLLGVWQDRYGPNRVGPGGMFQAVADGTKILFKQDWIPPFADRGIFVAAPAIGMMTVLLAFAVIPLTMGTGIAGDMNVGLLFVLGMMGLGVYAVVLAGWSSNSKYALLGGMRAAAQIISYEVFMGLSVLGVVMMAGSFNLRAIVAAQAGVWFIIPQCLGFGVFMLAGIAQTHRLPFDLPEGENELGAGFHTEYSGMKFGMFFIAEYAGIILVSSLVTTLYLGGWRGPLLPPAVWSALKTGGVVVFFILLRAGLPRPRYDQLMALGWKILLPLSLFNVMATGTILMLRAS